MANTPRSSRHALLLACLLPITASAAGWKFTPTLSLDERFTDNVALSASREAESSFITEVRPGFRWTGEGARGRFSVDYGLQGLIYSHDSDANTTNHQLGASLNSRWLDERLSLDADARVGQRNRSLLGAVGGGNYNTTGNLAETRSASITPGWKSRFGDAAMLEARWRMTYSDSDSENMEASVGHAVNLMLGSGTRFRKTPWQIGYALNRSGKGRVDADTGERKYFQNESLSARVGYLQSHKVWHKLTVGYDRNNGDDIGSGRVDGTWWTLGTQWSPTTRTTLNLEAGRRYGGNTYGIDFSHRTRKTAWTLRYVEALVDQYSQITGSDAFDIYLCDGVLVPAPVGSPPPDPVACGATPVLPAGPNASTSLVSDTSLSQNWYGTASYKTAKSLFSLNLGKSRRQFLSSGETDDHLRLGGNWSFRASPRVTSTLSLSTSRAESNDRDSRDWSLAWALSRQISRASTGVVEVRRIERSSGGETGPYSENSVSARVNMSF